MQFTIIGHRSIFHFLKEKETEKELSRLAQEKRVSEKCNRLCLFVRPFRQKKTRGKEED